MALQKCHKRSDEFYNVKGHLAGILLYVNFQALLLMVFGIILDNNNDNYFLTYLHYLNLLKKKKRKTFRVNNFCGLGFLGPSSLYDICQPKNIDFLFLLF